MNIETYPNLITLTQSGYTIYHNQRKPTEVRVALVNESDEVVLEVIGKNSAVALSKLNEDAASLLG